MALEYRCVGEIFHLYNAFTDQSSADTDLSGQSTADNDAVLAMAAAVDQSLSITSKLPASHPPSKASSVVASKTKFTYFKRADHTSGEYSFTVETVARFMFNSRLFRHHLLRHESFHGYPVDQVRFFVSIPLITSAVDTASGAAADEFKVVSAVNVPASSFTELFSIPCEAFAKKRGAPLLSINWSLLKMLIQEDDSQSKPVTSSPIDTTSFSRGEEPVGAKHERAVHFLAKLLWFVAPDCTAPCLRIAQGVVPQFASMDQRTFLFDPFRRWSEDPHVTRVRAAYRRMLKDSPPNSVDTIPL